MEKLEWNKEDIIDFIHCNDGITGKALASNILDSLKAFNVNLSKLVVKLMTEQQIYLELQKE